MSFAERDRRSEEVGSLPTAALPHETVLRVAGQPSTQHCYRCRTSAASFEAI